MNQKFKFTREKNPHTGLPSLNFDDNYGKECMIQPSSLVGAAHDWKIAGSSCLWLGTFDDPMHLKRHEVKYLVARLNKWLETGKI